MALGSGALMALSTAPLNAFPLAWVALVPLWMMVGSEPATLNPQPSKRVFLLALAWGIGYHGLALAWIRDLHPLTWLGIPWIGSVAIVLFAWSFITLWGAALVAIWAIGLSWVIRKRNDRSSWLTSSWHHVLVGTALWCGLEWLWSLGSLYWTSLSYTQSPGNLAILHLGQLSGPTTVTAAIVAVNGLIAEGWIRYQESEVRGQSNKAFYKLLSSAVVVVAVLHLVGYGLYSRPMAQFPEAALRVGLIQGNVPTRIKHTAEGRQQAVDGYVTGYERLADEGADAVLTPEGAFPFRWDDRDKAENSFYQAVQRKGRVGWLGTFVVQGDRLTQSLLTLTGDGQTLSRYNKLKIVPLGEYIPLRSILGVVINRLSPVQTDLLPGATDQTFETPFGRAIASICYDSAFPEVFRRQAATGGQFILTASNLDPYSEVLMAQHQAQDVMRAIETDRWAARATNTGYSGILDPHGRVQWRSQPRIYQLHTDTIYRRQTQTLYVRWGDWLTPLLGLAALGVVLQRQFLQSTTTP
ncbi:apolipoprotein N-acyltransferase [Leptolyngbya sp. FACHB-36]|uniref:apolipoprotein N-acyltransferase n=1 Tax=Leptolyngbya sp. FACHB-36 TaxID=2692808 RepID=UPI0032200CC9